MRLLLAVLFVVFTTFSAAAQDNTCFDEASVLAAEKTHQGYADTAKLSPDELASYLAAMTPRVGPTGYEVTKAIAFFNVDGNARVVLFDEHNCARDVITSSIKTFLQSLGQGI